MSRSFLRNAVILGLLSAVGPFAIDTYLPALPAISTDLGASYSAVQVSLIAFFAAVGLTQVIYGPLSDMYGRRVPLFVGIVLYIIASIGCALAPTIEVLIVMRFLQGIGACAGMTIPRAVVRDLHTGPDAARLMSLVMLVFSVSPMLAPLIGGLISEHAGWRYIFWFIGALGFVALALVAMAMPETRPVEARSVKRIGPVLHNYGHLLTDSRFVLVTLVGGFGMAAFFSYLTGASFLFIEYFGLSQTQFSLVFASNALAFIGMAQFNAWAGRRIGLDRVVLFGALAFSALTSTLLTVTLLGSHSMLVLWAMLFLSFGCLGFVVPSSAVLALDNHGPIAGTASALLGTIQILTGALIAVFVSLISDGTPLPLVTGIAVCGFATALCALVILPHWRRPGALPAE